MNGLLAQRCSMTLIYVEWLGVAAFAAFFALTGRALEAAFVAAVGGLALLGYVRVFPRISRYLGYGSVADRPAKHTAIAPAVVTLYTATGCPFCPIVRRRLLALKEQMGFCLTEVDLTLRPDLAVAKGIRSVPFLEIDARRLVGNATTDELVNFIAPEVAA